MIVRPDQDVNIIQLNNEILALGLPGFEGAGRKQRDLITGQPVTPFLTFRFADDNALSASDLAALDAALAAHAPVAEPTPRDFRAEYAAATRDAERIQVIADALHLT